MKCSEPREGELVLINQSQKRFLANKGAWLRDYRYDVTVGLAGPIQSSFETPSRHGSVMCLSEYLHGDQPGERTL